MLFTSRNRLHVFGLLFGAIALAACARAAPELPPDYGSESASAKLTADKFTAVDLRLTCPDIDREQTGLTTEAGGLTGVIESNRGRNQVAGYLGGLFLFPLVAAKNNPDEKRRLDELQARWDELTQLKRFKNCGVPSG